MKVGLLQVVVVFIFASHTAYTEKGEFIFISFVNAFIYSFVHSLHPPVHLFNVLFIDLKGLAQAKITEKSVILFWIHLM